MSGESISSLHPPIPVIIPTTCCAVTGPTTRARTNPAITTNKVQNTLFTCSVTGFLLDSTGTTGKNTLRQ
jgi:hypothetical protein